MSALEELNRFTAKLAEQLAELAGEVRDLKQRVVDLEGALAEHESAIDELQPDPSRRFSGKGGGE